MIEKLKIKGAWIGQEKELEAKKGKNVGQKFAVCTIGLFTPDDNAKYGGKFIGGSTFADEKGKRTATQVANDLKARIEANGGEEMYLDITTSKSPKNGKEYVNFRFPTKKEIEVAKQFIG